jgi:hypothetical protein
LLNKEIVYLSLAYNHGYFPQVTNASTVDVDIYQTIPATIEGGLVAPDFNYAMIVEEGAQITSIK